MATNVKEVSSVSFCDHNLCRANFSSWIQRNDDAITLQHTYGFLTCPWDTKGPYAAWVTPRSSFAMNILLLFSQLSYGVHF